MAHAAYAEVEVRYGQSVVASHQIGGKTRTFSVGQRPDCDFVCDLPACLGDRFVLVEAADGVRCHDPAGATQTLRGSEDAVVTLGALTFVVRLTDPPGPRPRRPALERSIALATMAAAAIVVSFLALAFHVLPDSEDLRLGDDPYGDGTVVDGDPDFAK